MIVVGSQSILGTFREGQPPADATMSVEIDILPIADDNSETERLADLIEGVASQSRCRLWATPPSSHRKGIASTIFHATCYRYLDSACSNGCIMRLSTSSVNPGTPDARGRLAAS